MSQCLTIEGNKLKISKYLTRDTKLNEREKVCKNYFFRAKKKLSVPADESDKEFIDVCLRETWSSFEAYLGWKFPEEYPKKMRRSFSSSYQKLFEGWNMSESFKESLNELCKLCPVKDMRPRKPELPKTINDPSKLFEILEVSYRIRSNLDHGSKELISETKNGIRNRQLVECSLKVTHEILEKVLLYEKIIQV